MRKICVATGTRADYGHLYHIIKRLNSEVNVSLQLLVCAMHLEARYGETWRVIEQDGFDISARVPLEPQDDTLNATAKSVGQGVCDFVDALSNLRPDLVVILGDRYEMLAIAQAAMFLQIPIAHIHGGEVTQGAMDDAIRHCITKMSHLHFAAAEPYAKRIIQMGEQPDRVFSFGAPGLDNLKDLPELDESWDFVITYHPVTLHADRTKDDISCLLSALDNFPDKKIIFTGVNSDPGNRVIHEEISAYVARHPDLVSMVASLGQKRYLAAVKAAGLVIGNSSSGIIEAPAVGVPTINIGQRQDGRLRSASVIDCAASEDEITQSIVKGLSQEFIKSIGGASPAYGKPGASIKIAQTLATFDLTNLMCKKFYDLEAKS